MQYRYQVDEDGSKEIDFQEFVHAIQINKAMSEKNSDESETLDAFISLGGNPDKSGSVLAKTLLDVIKVSAYSMVVELFSLLICDTLRRRGVQGAMRFGPAFPSCRWPATHVLFQLFSWGGKANDTAVVK
eukprot:scaffold7520_cov21-Tisochrysis_lutea.AAC.1